MLKSLVEDLSFIGKIKKNEKPCFSDKTCISTSEWFSTIKRRWKSEVGEKGVIYVDTLLNTLCSYVRNCVNEAELSIIREKLMECLFGLNNLVYTYDVDNQQQVSKDYGKCITKVEQIIKEIDKIKFSLKKDSFFYSTPSIIKD